jgi:hypothetical protein
VLGEQNPLIPRLSNAPVRDQAAGGQLDLDLIFGLAHFHAAAIHRHRVAVRVQGDLPLHIYPAMM